MALYFFNVTDGVTTLDNEGVELPDISSARIQAVQTAGQMLGHDSTGHFWTGEAWRMWVTDQPKGLGHTFFTLEFTAKDAGAPQVAAC